MRDSNYVVLVCGGRDYFDRDRVYQYLDALSFLHGGEVVIVTGAARGADTLAEDWAKKRQKIYMGYPAEWDKYDKPAGSMRNREMAHLTNPNIVVAFAGGRGTLNMLEVARSTMYNGKKPEIYLPDGKFWK